MDSRLPKFGIQPDQVPSLLSAAKALDMDVVGVSFHVGSDCFDASAYHDAIRMARDVFDQGARLGYRMSLLDIGGGFPGDTTRTITLDDIAAVVNASVADFFPPEMGVTVIGEPGQYLVCAAGTLVLSVVSKRRNEPTAEQTEPVRMFAHSMIAIVTTQSQTFDYYLNDGLHGCLHKIVYGWQAKAEVLTKKPVDAPLYSCTLWGPTCNPADRVAQDLWLPELEIGDNIIIQVCLNIFDAISS